MEENYSLFGLSNEDLFGKIHLQCENISSSIELFQVSNYKMVPCNQLTQEHKETKGELSLLFNTIYYMDKNNF